MIVRPFRTRLRREKAKSARRPPATAASPRRCPKNKCSVCWDPLTPQNIIILPCNHFFHATCLLTVRRFARFNDYGCPICHEPYNITQARKETALMQAAAVSIQRVFRGYITRIHTRSKMKTGSMLRSRWILSRAEQAGTRFSALMEAQSDAVDAILLEIDRELDWARTVMQEAAVHAQNIDWRPLIDAARSGGCGECPICFKEISEREGSVTSCGHCFHSGCICQWENHCRKTGVNLTCPCCRSLFQHRPLLL